MIEALLVNAFSIGFKGGNPAGVVLDADDISEDKMLEISSMLGFSESVFVLKSDLADFRLRYFSPIKEVDLCGHATIATFAALLSNDLLDFEGEDKVLLTIETKAGNFEIECFKDGLIMMKQDNPIFYYKEDDRKKIASLLGIDINDITEDPVQTVSTGVPKLLIPIKSLESLFNINPDLEGIKEYCLKNNTSGFYPFTIETKDENLDFHARQFSPLVGINEDPATGVAAGDLGAYAKKHLSKEKIIIEQGYVMFKPSNIYVDMKGENVKVGGYAYVFDKKIFE